MERTGQSGARELLGLWLQSGSLPHALLIESATDEGATDFARLVAQGAMCTGETKPCGSCRNCRKNEKGVHPDVLLYGGGGGARSFHIETVRELRQQAYIRPGEASCKALILQNVQTMSIQAQNALLKVIEEPPPGTLFLLTCDSRAAMLETILSRVTVIALDSARAPGEPQQKALELLAQLCAGSELEALAFLSAYERDRTGLQELLSALRQVVCGILLEKPLPPEETQRIRAHASRLQLLQFLAIIDETVAGLAGNAGGPLLCTLFCAKIRLVLDGTAG